MTKTYLIVGASRGIGLEFVRQLLARGDQVIAAVRDPFKANDLYRLTNSVGMRPGALVIHQCDVTREDSIDVSTEFSLCDV
jgi:NAD(P)-dependent dehydrogenase (short-subunit alcohol dehydrogenase family)